MKKSFKQWTRQELKKVFGGRGQLLSAMLATAALNADNIPIYGTFVQGRLWFFLAYHDRVFAETPAFDILKLGDLVRVMQILKQQKVVIAKRLVKP